MSDLNFKKTVKASVEEAVGLITAELKRVGFGVLTRIDLHTKIKEKLGHDLKPVVILGACNPAIAFEAYQRNTDVTSLLPCNVVVRELEGGRVSVELAKPSAMLKPLGDPSLSEMAKAADLTLASVLERI